MQDKSHTTEHFLLYNAGMIFQYATDTLNQDFVIRQGSFQTDEGCGEFYTRFLILLSIKQFPV